MDESTVYPQPPHLKLNFYFGDDVLDKSFITLFKALLQIGAIYRGDVGILKADYTDQKPFNGRPTNVTQLRASADAVLEFGCNDRIRLITADFNNAVGLSKRGEYLSYAQISERAAQSDHPPLQIVTSAHVFNPIPEFEKKAVFAGRKVY